MEITWNGKKIKEKSSFLLTTSIESNSIIHYKELMGNFNGKTIIQFVHQVQNFYI